MDDTAIKTSWDLSPLGASDNDPKFDEERKKIEEVNYAFITKWKERTDYLEDATVLKEALDELEMIEKSVGTDGDEGYYFWLRAHLNESDPDIKAKENKIDDFAKKISNDRQFFLLKLAKVPEDIQKKFLSAPELSSYTHFLELLFAESKYLLSDAEEKIMTLKSNSAHSAWVRMTEGFLSKSERSVRTEDGKQELKSFEEIMDLMNSQQKNVRDEAAQEVNDILASFVEVAEAEINAILADKKVNDELRGFERPDSSRHVGDDIDTDVVDAMLDAVSGRFDLAQRYYRLKAKLMGVDTLAYHERNVPYGALDKAYTFPEATDVVIKVFESLDSEFADILTRFLRNGQIDAFPAKGKHGGAFCVHVLLSQPTYVLLNFTNKLRDVETIAHEMGHAINNELMRKTQNALNFGTPMATAEVASTFMEDFVNEEIMKTADDELRLALLMNKLNGDVSSIMRQVACYQFEQELHKAFREKGYLSHKEIGAIFQKHMASYMGDAVEQSEGAQNWWVYWSHIRSFFYVYSYASGLLISKSMQASVRADHGFIEKVKEFLSAGTSLSPKEIFAKMDIDITDKSFWDKGLTEIERLLDETEQLATTLGKIPAEQRA